MIEINDKYTKELASRYSIGKPTFTMYPVDSGNYVGYITYPIFNESNVQIDNIVYNITEQNWNSFWNGFADFNALLFPLTNNNINVPEGLEEQVVNVFPTEN